MATANRKTEESPIQSNHFGRGQVHTPPLQRRLFWAQSIMIDRPPRGRTRGSRVRSVSNHKSLWGLWQHHSKSKYDLSPLWSGAWRSWKLGAGSSFCVHGSPDPQWSGFCKDRDEIRQSNSRKRSKAIRQWRWEKSAPYGWAEQVTGRGLSANISGEIINTLSLPTSCSSVSKIYTI